ncbi:protein NUCLEAR FUSION DEFECTIVE 6, chloroplastic/mitochondrial-like isoform X2 [Durio zibethinus]|uniref:Protein NUCLEAR FUSION DEFECTIVE 6, chloroplastic/mitochondrial-like isoform X2 n=1 Tax=Durio zibethinus TaxID=66656 RepID=A0A6P5X656_DURZI|nr:protein NUCLEAR FUSION DEFECTIVE 6, chloroplastic/mitochondrial-like isoform X2 [Durio zibethinus]
MSAARSVLRSAASRATAATRVASAPKPMLRPACSPFRISKQNPLSSRIFRSPVELSCCVETMLPYHTATASALLTSMLSVSRRSAGWTPEGLDAFILPGRM